jgi:hypothetical protein
VKGARVQSSTTSSLSSSDRTCATCALTARKRRVSVRQGNPSVRTLIHRSAQPASMLDHMVPCFPTKARPPRMHMPPHRTISICLTRVRVSSALLVRFLALERLLVQYLVYIEAPPLARVRRLGSPLFGAARRRVARSHKLAFAVRSARADFHV